jgi:adenylate kinase family enzyme
MHKIIVIGCPGVGKTTFAKELAKKTNLPLVHLDYHYYDLPKNYHNDKDAWKNLVRSLVAKDRWIIEGNYKSTFDVRLPAADTIIFFDYPRYVAMWRALKRRIQYRNKLRTDMPAGWKEKLDLDFVKFIWNFNANVKPMIHELLPQYKDRKTVIILNTPKETHAFLRSLDG